MKKETIERWLLLEQSGELDLARRWLLRRHLASDPEARAERDRLLALAKAVREQDVAGPDQRVLEAIRREARAAGGRATEVLWTPARARARHPALAWASAALLVALAGWLIFRPEPGPDQRQATGTPPAAAAGESELAWDNGIDSDLQELASLLALSSESGDATAEEASAADAETLATELLSLEGSEI